MDLKINKVRGHDPDQSGLGEGHVLGCCKHVNELSGSIKLGEFLDQLSNNCGVRRTVLPWWFY